MLLQKHRYLLFLIFISLPCLCFAEKQNKVQFERLSVKDGLSQISVMSLFQDSMGFMWFGTREGLNKYDGYNFHIYRESEPENYISNNYIECMEEDKLGRMWVGTRWGLNRYDRESDSFITYYSTNNDSTPSNNNTICMLKDCRGELWIGTQNGLNRYIVETDNFSRCNFNGLPPELRIYALTEDHDNNIWIGTDKGLYVYNTLSGRVLQYTNNPEDNNSISGNRISALFRDSKDRIWVGIYRLGICLFNAKENSFLRFRREHGLSDNSIRCIEEDSKGNILVGTFDGLCCYDELCNKFTPAYNDSDDDAILMGNFSVYDVLCDRSGTVWVGTYSGGVSYYSPYNQRFRVYDPGMQGRKIYGIVGPIQEHATGLWMGTEGGGLLFFDRSDNSYTYYLLPSSSNQFSRNIIKSLYINGDCLWLGTTRNTVYSFDIKNRKFKQTINPPWGNYQYVLFKDSKQRLWIGASDKNTLGYIDQKGQFTIPPALSSEKTFNASSFRGILEDSPGIFYICTFGEGLFRYDELSQTVTHFNQTENSNYSRPKDRITSMCKTKNNDIWISTFGDGIGRFDRTNEQIIYYVNNNGLANNTVYTLIEDKDGILWLSTSDGISKFDPKTETFTNYNKKNGINISEFTPGSGITTSDNEIFFGGNDGFVSFFPDRINNNDYIPPVHITKVFVNNKPLEKTDYSINNTIRLNYKQSNISIEYCALNYIYPSENQYTYKMEDFDDEWNDVGNRRVAYYTNIPPGKYTFIIKGSNNDRVWNDMETTLNITITPPPWNTWWAWTIYVLIITSAVYLIVRYSRIRTALENNIKIKQLEKDNMEELHQTKIMLFTNFSHELRTPLTLILSPLEDILQQTELNPTLRNALRLMHKNANRLLYTVNQLMDFRKKESGHLQIKAAEGNIVKFIHEIFIAFNELARLRNISFHFDCGQEELQLWYDRDLLEKVLFNLLSNAFKNTPDNGCITVRFSQATLTELLSSFNNNVSNLPTDISSFVLIEVIDTGSGIPETELERIFDPFYQVFKKNHPQPFGTGIGLNLSKGIVAMHHGAIWACNVPDKGAAFRIVLPLGKSHLKENELVPDFLNSEKSSHYLTPDISPVEEGHTSDILSEYSVLIVEDNIDVRHYISSHISKHYKTYEATNGKDALEMAIKHLPDLIISDVMMPVMDGIELCHLLKNDLRTGHIPVILLTARVTVMQIQEGFEIGADDYITKPFNAGILLVRIQNLISSREKLKELFGQSSSATFPELPTSSIDSKFMDSVYKYIDANLAEPNLSMDQFCREICMSRSNFYRKIKTLSDLTPNELIRNTRVQVAAKYLRETNLTISEVAYAVGFSSPSYFTKSFRLFYNESPSEMRDKQRVN